MRDGAPIRFLVLLLGAWTCVRLAMTAPAWWVEAVSAARQPALPNEAVTPETRPQTAVASAAVPLDPGANRLLTAAGPTPSFAMQRYRARPFLSRRPDPAFPASFAPHRMPSALMPGASQSSPAAPATPVLLASIQPPVDAGAAIGSQTSRAGRLSGSAWLLARRDGGAALAPGGTLGGSQAGARLLYRLNNATDRPLSLSARIYAPLRRIAGAEAALGLDWRPIARLPIHILAERRQGLGGEGRSAFALTAYGGGAIELGSGWRLDGYAQAGIVGTRSRDAFVDGSTRLLRTIGPVEVGGGFWGAAQPGTSRLDVGPQIAAPIRIGPASLRLAAEYRFRIAGDARPSSGPALTLGVDF